MGLLDTLFGAKKSTQERGQETSTFQQTQDTTSKSQQTDASRSFLDSLRRGTTGTTTGVDVTAPGVQQTLDFLLGQQGAGDVQAGRSTLRDIASGGAKNNLLDLLASREQAFQTNLPFLVNQARGTAFGAPQGAANAAVAEVVARAGAGEEATAQQLIAEILGRGTQNELAASNVLFQTPQSQSLALLSQLGRRGTGETTETQQATETSEAERLLNSLVNSIASGTSSRDFSGTSTGKERGSIFDIANLLSGNVAGGGGIGTLTAGPGNLQRLV